MGRRAEISDKVEFTGSQGDRLAARLDRPPSTPRAWALFAHCFSCSKDLAAASRVSRALARQGIAVLRFDFTGLGRSEGDFANTDFSSNVEDLVLAAEYLAREYGPPSLLIGHSLGGAAVLAAAPRIPDLRAVVTIGAPADPAHVERLFGAKLTEIRERGEAEVDLAGRTFRIRSQFLEDIEAQNLKDSLAKLRPALMVMHSPTDELVGIDNASEIFVNARHPKSFVSLDGADHLLSRKRDAEWVAGTIASWVERYLPDPPSAETAADDQGEVVVEESGANAFTQTISAGPHRLVADEPPSVGGADTGPTPYGLLLASLGACTSMTLRMYADRKKLPLEHVRVRLRHEKIHATDCAQCETETGRVDHIEKEIELTGPLDDAQRQRLLEIADRCPVHRTLHSEVSVASRLV